MWGRRGGKEKKARKKPSLTPDSECDLPLKVSVREGGDVAGVASLVRHRRGGDEQGRVVCGGAALEPHPVRVATIF